MFQHHNNTLCIQAAALYNKPMYDEIDAMDKKAKKALSEGLQDEFMIYMQELKVLKIHYKRSEDTYLGKEVYFKNVRRGKLKRLVDGGNGRTALVDYDSLGVDLQAKIEERIGYNYKRQNVETNLS